MRDLVRSYYAQIRSLLRDRPDLRPYLKRCTECGILFFTDPRNAARSDLRCGFGCREGHRRQSSRRRTAEYYRRNPDEKQRHNRNRYLRSHPDAAKAVVPRPAGGGDRGLNNGVLPPPPFLGHLRMLISLIERRRVGREEVVKLLARNWRQHRMERKRGEDYGQRRTNDRGS